MALARSPRPSFVLDASVTLAWGLRDEVTPYSDAVEARMADDRAAVPMIWSLEVANVVLISERRGRLTRAESANFLLQLATLRIEIDNPEPTIQWAALMTIARAHGLSAYDASYLELALRLGLPLATQDNRLRAVAAQVGVPIFDPHTVANSTNGQGTT